MRNLLSTRLREMVASGGEKEARRWLSLSYSKARGLVVRVPPFRNGSAAHAKIIQIERAADAAMFSERSGPTDRAVLQANIVIAQRAAKLEYGASVREVAELGGLLSGTVSKSHRRLVSRGWLRSIERWHPYEAARWQLCLPDGSSGNIQSARGCEDEWFRTFLNPNADVWRCNGGLGKRRWFVWRRLEGQTIQQLARTSGITVRAMRQHLTALRNAGLAERRADRRWYRKAADLDGVAATLAVAGEAERQRERHLAERQSYRRMFGSRTDGPTR